MLLHVNWWALLLILIGGCINWSGNANARQRRRRRQQHLGGDCEENMRTTGAAHTNSVAEVEWEQIAVN